jgi:hypothetical protein
MRLYNREGRGLKIEECRIKIRMLELENELEDVTADISDWEERRPRAIERPAEPERGVAQDHNR